MQKHHERNPEAIVETATNVYNVGMLTRLTKETDDTLKTFVNNKSAMNKIHKEHFDSAMNVLKKEATNQKWDQDVVQTFEGKLEKKIKVTFIINLLKRYQCG